MLGRLWIWFWILVGINYVGRLGYYKKLVRIRGSSDTHYGLSLSPWGPSHASSVNKGNIFQHWPSYGMWPCQLHLIELIEEECKIVTESHKLLPLLIVFVEHMALILPSTFQGMLTKFEFVKCDMHSLELWHLRYVGLHGHSSSPNTHIWVVWHVACS